MSESESLVERVARAIIRARHWSCCHDRPISDFPVSDHEMNEARAAIRAMRDTVPVIRDGEGFPAHQLVGAPEDVWRAFIDAALA